MKEFLKRCGSLILALLLACSAWQTSLFVYADENASEDTSDPVTDTSEAFLFEPTASGESYILCGVSSFSDTVLNVPSEYNGLPVTEIAADAFYANATITDITIPSTVTAIGDRAFSECDAVTSVTFDPDGKLVTIGGDAFLGCDKLAEIDIPRSVTEIGNGAFARCGSLLRVGFAWDSTLETLPTDLFNDCAVLQSVDVPQRVKTIGDRAFYHCVSLTSIEIPNRVETISAAAFDGCVALETLAFERNSRLATIGEGAFGGCTALNGVELPRSLETVGAGIFSGCTNLSDLTFFGTVEDWNAVEKDTFWNNGMPETTELVYVTPETDENNLLFFSLNETQDGYAVLGLNRFAGGMLTIPATLGGLPVVAIAEDAFNGNDTVTGVYIPNTVTEICDRAFAECSALATVTFEEGSTLWRIGNDAFLECNALTGIHIPSTVTEIGYGVFARSANLMQVVFGEGIELEALATDLFNACPSIVSVVLPETLVEIGDRTFYHCTSLDWIDIPASVERIGNGAFEGCVSLKKVAYPDESALASIGAAAFYDCAALSEADIPAGVTWIDQGIFEDCAALTRVCYRGSSERWAAMEKSPLWHSGMSVKATLVTLDKETPLFENTEFAFEYDADAGVYVITSLGEFEGGALTIPAMHHNVPVGRIADDAFNGADTVTSVTIPDTVTAIGERAFTECNAMTSVIFAENSGLRSIGGDAFLGCDELTELDIPSSVTEIGNGAFARCGKLTRVNFAWDSTLETLPMDLFNDCAVLESVNIPQTTRTVGVRAFYHCVSLVSVEIPNRVETICAAAFEGCVALETVAFERNSRLATIDGGAFGGCEALDGVELPRGLTTVGSGVFSACTALANLSFFGTSEDWDAVEKDEFWNDGMPETTEIAFVTPESDENSVLFFALNETQDGYTVQGLNRFAGGMLTIPASFGGLPVVAIAEDAFNGNDTVTGVYIPNTVTEIRDRAFTECSALATVTFEENSTLTYIGWDAFLDCDALESFHIPSSVTEMANGVFARCANLAEVTFGEGITLSMLAIDLFNDCPALRDVVIPASVTAIGDRAFYHCASLESITIPRGVTAIGGGAFDSCSKLASVIYEAESGLLSIGEAAFCYCTALTDMTIPSAVTRVEYGILYGCESLMTIRYLGTKAAWDAVEKSEQWNAEIPADASFSASDAMLPLPSAKGVVLMEYDEEKGWYVVTGLNLPENDSVSATGLSSLQYFTGGHLEIPSACHGIPVCVIGAEAFKDCDTITGVTIPSSIRNIEDYAFTECDGLETVEIAEGSTLTHIGWDAFLGCDALTGFDVPATVTEIENGAFARCASLTRVSFADGIQLATLSVDLFNDCPLLDKVVIPVSVTEIGMRAFYHCASMEFIEIPSGVTAIGLCAFENCTALSAVLFAQDATLASIGECAVYGCTTLENIVIPSSIRSLDYGVFYGCENLMTIRYLGTKEEWQAVEVSAYWSEELPATVVFSALDGILPLPEVKSFVLMAYDEVKGYYVIRGLNLPEGESESATGRDQENVFEGGCLELPAYCHGIPIGEIAEEAFYDCDTITGVIIPSTVQVIGDRAFSECDALGTVTFADDSTLRDIGGDAFLGCDALARFDVPATVTEIGNGAFARCANLTTVTFGEGIRLETLSVDLFNASPVLSDITIPEGVKTIGARAFYHCEGLETLAIPKSVTSIGAAAFECCTALTVVTFEKVSALSEIAGGAFHGCAALSSVEIPRSVTLIEGNVFFGCDTLKTIAYLGADVEWDLIVKEDSWNVGLPEDYTLSYALGTTFTLNVVDENGDAFPTERYQLTWYRDGESAPVGSGNALYGVYDGEIYYYAITLGEEDSYIYRQPERGTVTVNTDVTEQTVVIEAYRTATLCGKVVSTDGTPIVGATVSLRQLFGEYSRDTVVYTDAEGLYTAELMENSVQIRVSCDGYRSTSTVYVPSDEEESLTVGDLLLETLTVNRLTLDMNMETAVKAGQTASLETVARFDGLVFTLVNRTTGEQITDFTLQYPYIILGDDAAAYGDEIAVTATDTRGGMTAAEGTAVLDQNRNGSLTLLFTQRGKLAAEDITGSGKYTVMLFDADGNLVKTYLAETAFVSDAMANGTYTVVIIERNNALRSVSHLDKLSAFALSAGVDYFKAEASVSSGCIGVISDVTVPTLDEAKLYYTVPEDTRVVLNETKTVAGKYLIMRVEYAIKDRYETTEECVTVELPEGVAFVQGSMTLDGTVVSCEESDGVLTVYTNRQSGILRFYLTAVSEGEYRVNAELAFTSDGAPVLQPLGEASFSADALTMQLPKRTAKNSIPVSGVSVAKATVVLYDGDVEIGRTISDIYGKWSIQAELSEPYSLSYHKIFAEVHSERLDDAIRSEAVILTHDARYVEASRVTMINTAHPAGALTPQENITVYDFLTKDGTTPSYSYWASYPTFTFKAEFTGGDNTTLSNVVVVTVNDAGEETYVKCTYDAAQNVWIGTQDYPSFYDAPSTVYVTYNLTETQDYTLDVEKVSAYAEEMDRLMSSFFVTASNEVAFDKAMETEEYTIYAIRDESSEEYFAHVAILNTDFATLDLTDADYMRFDENDPSLLYGIGEMNGFRLVRLVDVENEVVFDYVIVTAFDHLTGRGGETETYASDYVEDINALRDGYLTLENETEYAMTLAGGAFELMNDETEFKMLEDTVGNVVSPAVNAADLINRSGNYYILMDAISDYETIYNERVKTIYELLGAKDANGNYRLSTEDMERFNNGLSAHTGGAKVEYDSLREQMDAYRHRVVVDATATIPSMALDKLIGKAGDKANGKDFIKKLGQNEAFNDKLFKGMKALDSRPGKMTATAYDWLLEQWSDENADAGVTAHMDMDALTKYIGATHNEKMMQLDQLTDAILDAYDNGGEGEEGKKVVPKGSQSSPSTAANKEDDPSGYVYEAVPSNRVEGVKAELYYYDYPLDEFGVPEENKADILWDAEAYGQINPQYTDKNGMFAWDVPAGEWLVKLSKEGYYDTDSRGDVAANENGYLPVPPPQLAVNTAIVSKAAPTVKNVYVYRDEIRIEFSQYMRIESVTAKTVTVRCGGSAVAGTVRPVDAEYNYEGTVQYASTFVFTPDRTLDGDVRVLISGVSNYAGTAMTSVYSGIMGVSVRPESISVKETVFVEYGSGAMAEIRILPVEAGRNKTLTVVSSSPSIVGVTKTTLKTDANGRATVMMDGLLPGTATVTVLLEGSEISASTVASVEKPIESILACAPVTADVESGAEVACETKLTLSSATVGASIYYTLDGSDPREVDNPARVLYTGPITFAEDMNLIAYAVKSGATSSDTTEWHYTVSHTYGEWSAYDGAEHTRACDCGHEEISAHVWESGVCTDCGVLHATLLGSTLTLEGNIGLNFYFEIDEALLANESAVIRFDLEDGRSAEIPVSQGRQNTTAVPGKVLYVYTCEVYAKQMTDTVCAKLVLGESESITYRHSVVNYAKVIIDNEKGAYSESEIALVKSMLRYGANAQLCFDYETGELADAVLAGEDSTISAVDADTLAKYAASGTTAEGIGTFAGATLLLESETTLKVYFKPEAGVAIESLTFFVDGTAVTPVAEGEYHVIFIRDIPSDELDRIFTITAQNQTNDVGATCTCSVFSYGYSVLSKPESFTVELQDTVRALYLYNLAADDFFN